MLYQFILEPYKGVNTRYTCPSCGKRRVFTRYIDKDTGKYVSEDVGRCNREIKCSYHVKPKQYFDENKTTLYRYWERNIVSNGGNLKDYRLYNGIKPASYISIDILKESLKKYSENNLVQFLINRFGTVCTNQLIGKYFIGTSTYWKGATVFWQIDKNGRVRTGKIMLYSSATGRRSREKHHAPYWVHKSLNKPDYTLKQCFFGEHLLIDNVKPVAICESEKTALIASVYLPEFLWLACGSINGLSMEKCTVLKNQSVVLFPDLKALDKWKQKAKELSIITNFTVSNLLERGSMEVEKEQGLDLADYLLRFSLSTFKSKPIQICMKEILSVVAEVHTGAAFSNMIIVGIKGKSGELYDLLFNEAGEIIKPGEKSEEVRRMADFYEKKWLNAYLDDSPCWLHIYS